MIILDCILHYQWIKPCDSQIPVSMNNNNIFHIRYIVKMCHLMLRCKLHYYLKVPFTLMLTQLIFAFYPYTINYWEIHTPFVHITIYSVIKVIILVN